MSKSKKLKELAAKGDSSAQRAVGILGELGLADGIDPVDSFLSWKAAAESGDGFSMLSLAECYQNGKGTKQDQAEAKKWYAKAKEKGFVPRKKRKDYVKRLKETSNESPTQLKSFPYKHVLIVEDSPIANFDITSRLKKYQVKISVAQDGQHGVEIFKKYKTIDLIILDIGLPVLDGIGFLKTIRNTLKSETKVFVLTSNKQPNTIKLASQLGISGWLLKPANKLTIERIINESSQSKSTQVA